MLILANPNCGEKIDSGLLLITLWIPEIMMIPNDKNISRLARHLLTRWTWTISLDRMRPSCTLNSTDRELFLELSLLVRTVIAAVLDVLVRLQQVWVQPM